MVKRNILVVSDPSKRSVHLNEWMNHKNEFLLNVAETDERAIELMHLHSFDMVLTDNTDNEIDSNKLKAVTPYLQNDTLVIKHEGESADELHQKVNEAFEFRKAERMVRILVLDSSDQNYFTGLPAFSLN